MFTLAAHRIIVLCLPSHTTHLLQPLDAGVNKFLKSSLALALQETLNASAMAGLGALTSSDISAAVCHAMSSSELPVIIQNSFRHVGLWPVNPSLVTRMVLSERAQKSALVNTVLEIIEPVLEDIRAVATKKRKRDDAQNEQHASTKRLKFDSSHASVLNSPEKLVLIEIGTKLRDLNTMKADELRNEVIKMGVKLEDAQVGGEWKSMKTLKALAIQKLQETQDNLICQATKRLETVILHFDDDRPVQQHSDPSH